MKVIAVLLLVCLLLTGCGSWMDGEYHSVTPHKIKEMPQDQQIPSVNNYAQLKAVISQFVEEGTQEMLLSVEDYQSTTLDNSMQKVIAYITQSHPIGAYAVESVSYELGTSGGIRAVAVNVTYSRNPDEIRNIRTCKDMESVKTVINEALTQCDSSVVIRMESFEQTDFVRLVEDFAEANPDLVMELPQVNATVYPEVGEDRVVDIRFVYQTNRDSLRQMQKYVQPVFTSAALYVSSEEETSAVKFARLYTFLMERNDYKVETSITPTYSLLRHGVGDGKAFAQVYAAMCRKAGLECLVVTGTHQGEARVWNIICEDSVYYHLDLLGANRYAKYTDEQMNGYVWDYSAYPTCGQTQTVVTE